MKSTANREKTRRGRLTKLAQVMVRGANPDVYFAQNERFQQVNLPLPELGEYICVAPEQIIALARIENYNVLMHSSRR